MSKTQNLNAGKGLVFIIALSLVSLLLNLGFWQLERATEKELLLEQWQEPAISMAAMRSKKALSFYQKVAVKGQLNAQQYYLLDNKTRNGNVGYEVLVVFTTIEGNVFLLNLGWLAASIDRSILPTIELPKGIITVTGWLKKIEKVFQLQADIWSANWPKRIQQIELSKMIAVTDTKQLIPLVLLAEQPLLSFMSTQWKPVNMSVEKHIGYAVQWFAMAFALCIMFVWLWRKSFREIGNEEC
ncbi:MAG: surfeit locus 1 family protein [Oceanospirillaceae bacterium]|jgi:surfeit locus 1 family protein